MRNSPLPLSICLSALALAGCFQDVAPPSVGETDTSGDGDGDPGDGDGAPGDGDGSPGDGDGDGSPGDGDGAPGDGDGAPGDGDGAPLPDPQCDDGVPVPGEICYGDAELFIGGDVVYDAHFADVNGDGNLDVVYLLGDGTIQYHIGTGTGVFASATDMNFGIGGGKMFVAHLDGNDTIDMVIGSFTQVQAMLGNGGGGFGQSALVDLAGEITALWVGSFDGDGDVDVLSAAGNNIRVDYNNGSGAFTAPYTNQVSGGTMTALGAGDFNGDELPDVVIGRATGLDVRPGTGVGISFASVFDPNVAASISALGVGDFNGDGRPDIAYADETANNVGWVLGVGAGAFLNPDQVSRPGGPRTLVVADFDADGFDDFAVGGANSRVWVFRSLGDGSFADPVEIPVAFPVDGLFADGDANGDGVIDLIASGINADQAAAILSTP